MIVLSAHDQQSLKAGSSRPARQTTNSSDSVVGLPPVLPDYETSQAQHSDSLSDLSDHSQATFLKRRLHPRCWRTSLVALATYIVISAFIGIPHILHKFTHPRYLNPSLPPISHVAWDDDPLNYPDNENNINVLAVGDYSICDRWDQFTDDSTSNRLSSRRSFTVESNGALTIRCNATGHVMYGDFSIDINPDSTIQDPVFVLQSISPNIKLRNGTRVCYNPSHSERGFSIFVPDNVTSSDDLHISISILLPRLPAAMRSSRLSISMPLFTQHIHNISSVALFHKVTLQGFKSKIIVDHLTAHRIEIKSSSAAISGTFNASRAIDPIDANITLFNDQSKGLHPTVVSMDTGNGQVTTNIRLQSPSTIAPANFLLELKTFSGAINAKIAHDSSTLPSLIHLRAENSNAQANYTVDSKFFGTFDVQSKLATTTVQEEQNRNMVPDPSGAGRQRQYAYLRTLEEHVRGWVGWGDPPSKLTGEHRVEMGSIEILSSLDSATLMFVDASS